MRSIDRLQRWSAWTAVGVVLTFSLLAESAQALVIVQATGSAGGGCLNANVCGNLTYYSEFADSGPVSGTSTSIGPIQGQANGAQSSVAATATLGALMARASAVADATNTLATASAQLSWFDTFTVVPLGPGDMFSFGARLELDIGTLLSAMYGDGGWSDAHVGASVLISGSGVNVVLDTRECLEAGVPCTGLYQLVDTAGLDLRPGQRYSIFGTMDVGVDALNYAAPSSAVTGIVDVGHTARFFLDPLTPGATYTTESGVMYLTPTSLPEPAALYLIGCVLLGMVACSKKRG